MLYRGFYIKKGLHGAFYAYHNSNQSSIRECVCFKYDCAVESYESKTIAGRLDLLKSKIDKQLKNSRLFDGWLYNFRSQSKKEKIRKLCTYARNLPRK